MLKIVLASLAATGVILVIIFTFIQLLVPVTVNDTECYGYDPTTQTTLCGEKQIYVGPVK